MQTVPLPFINLSITEEISRSGAKDEQETFKERSPASSEPQLEESFIQPEVLLKRLLAWPWLFKAAAEYSC